MSRFTVLTGPGISGSEQANNIATSAAQLESAAGQGAPGLSFDFLNNAGAHKNALATLVLIVLLVLLVVWVLHHGGVGAGAHVDGLRASLGAK